MLQKNETLMTNFKRVKKILENTSENRVNPLFGAKNVIKDITWITTYSNYKIIRTTVLYKVFSEFYEVQQSYSRFFY